MIRPAQLKLLERARAAAAPDPDLFAEMLSRFGGADRIKNLTPTGFDRLLDQLTVRGFRDRQRPILSQQTRIWIEQTFPEQLNWTPFAFKSVLLSRGIADVRDMDGRQLLNLLIYFEDYGLSIWSFNTARREISKKQLRLIQAARKKIRLSDQLYYPALQLFGAVNTANDLDRRGFDLMMAFLDKEGFVRVPIAPTATGFGRRPGFASPEQVELIRSLWREWSGPSAESDAAVEAGLNAWLERYHRASALRFVTSSGAAKVITGLKAMKARKAAASKREAHHA